MENKRRGRPCKEEKMTNHSIRLDKEDQDRLDVLCKQLDLSPSKTIRFALKLTYNRLVPSEEEYFENCLENTDDDEENIGFMYCIK